MQTHDAGAAAAPSAPASIDLAARARAAIAWSTGFQLFRDLFQFGLMLVLVRLLPADAYGKFGFVTTLVSFLTIFSFREFLNHTLQLRDGDEVPYQDHFTAGAVIQAGLFVVANLVALGLSYAPAYAPAAPLIHVMSFVFPLDLAAEFRAKTLERSLDWRRLRALHGLGIAISGLASVALAAAGWGAYALFIPLLMHQWPLIWDLFVVERFRPTWTFQWRRYRAAFDFGSSRMIAVTCVGGAGLLESSWLAGAFGFALLGILSRATALSQLLCGRIGGILGPSVYPVLTRVSVVSQSFTRASAMYLRAVAWAVVPVAVIVAALADPLVRLMYGATWIDAIPLVPLAVAVAALTAIVQTVYTMLLASGAHRRCLMADVWRLIGTATVLIALVPLGLQAYLTGLIAMHVVAFGIVIDYAWRAGVLSPRAIADAFGPAFVAVGAAGVLFWALGELAAASYAGAAGSAAGFATVYFIVLRVLFARQLRELIGYLPEGGRLGRVLRLPAAA